MGRNVGFSRRARVADAWSKEDVQRIEAELAELRTSLLEMETGFESELGKLPADRQPSARNLLHYVALRQRDLRALQEELIQRGLSSLGRCESHVLDNVESVLDVLARVSGRTVAPSTLGRAPVNSETGQTLIEQGAARLLGVNSDHAGPCVMVTMPSTAASDYELVHSLVASGMDLMRINCAHDDEAAWAGMIGNLRRAEASSKRTCRVAMDLGGPKIRTGEIEPGPQVARWQPARDSFGRPLSPARIWLFASRQPAPPPIPCDAAVPMDGELFSKLQPGDQIRFRDAAGRLRRLAITTSTAEGFWAESRQTTYVTPGLDLRLAMPERSSLPSPSGRIGALPPVANYLVLRKGDRLMLTDPQLPGRPAVHDDRGQLVHPARIGCTLPSILPDLKRGERILFDDGKIGGVIQELYEHYVVVEITKARVAGEKLRADKGINLPDSTLTLPALTDKDIADLAFVVRNADVVSYSFVRHVEDVERLQAELARLGRPDFPIILKIENRQAFENLPRLLLAVMRNPSGVMIARGDLAVECGYERLAEVQEEILWMCEAAHMPVIWATQVLETMAKRGIPSRAEVTDAASSVRAECVMLNKGPYIVEAVHALEDILQRMQSHQIKKRPMLRKLRLAESMLPLRGVPKGEAGGGGVKGAG